ncbi:hypothetical protein FNV43_RR06983 [Rhamnella rubrinervis]|uniref:CTLH domain-containing protein n=1 Tax=Rhamnella rubrinervis TaxID=2594499 RepID=A0A8K0HEU4_9ROSA|nr:hypothetical protein FNV43_RR06983 [Rhamnella rubrinervis]
MSSLNRELVFLILQFLDEEKFSETVHKLEKESGVFFNMRYFEDCVLNGEWDEVEKYLSGFMKVEDNSHSSRIFFEIRKQRYLEALDEQDHSKAVEILRNDLKVFANFNQELFKDITKLLTLGNFRENEQLSKYGETKNARGIMLDEIKFLIESNPHFRDRLQFPSLRNMRLRTLINQSLNWQHHLCKNRKPDPDIKTLFVDHNCGQSNATVGGFPPLGAHGPFQPGPPLLTASHSRRMAYPSYEPHQSFPVGCMGLSAPRNAGSFLKRPRTPPTNNSAMDYQTAVSELALRRSRPLGIPEEVNNLPVNVFPVSYPGQISPHTSYSSDDLPKTVVANLNQGSSIKSLDFHPVHQTLLLGGTNIGDITIWEVASRERLVFENFKIWDLEACSETMQASMANDYIASVNRVVWSPDGSLFGVAYSKHIVHLYSYPGGGDLRNHVEIDAHVGNVSDIAFSHPNKQLCIITCGEDKAIKVWNAVTGNKLYTFEGHEAPVYSVCPHQNENIQFIFSTATDGKIKAWLYDNMGSRVNYDAPGHSCTRMAYSCDGTRLFSCGTNEDGESYLLEWDESEGAIKRSYHGLGKRTMGVVQFDTTKNRFLAAGDESHVKFWDMDNINLLTTTDAEGGLLASPCIRFNKEGMLLAVSTSDNGIKILANADGLRLLLPIEGHAADASRLVSGIVPQGPGTFGASSLAAKTSGGVADTKVPLTAMIGLNGDSQSLADVKPKTNDDLEKSKIRKLTEVNEPSQLCSLRLPDSLMATKIVSLTYTNSGRSVLALTYNAVHKLWKWQKNVSGKATTTVPPQLCQPSSGILMTNEISVANVDDAVPCFALSKNDSYVISASGGRISLFNMMTFNTMTKFMPPPPAATFLAFHPTDNNIMAIGMEDSSIRIYNVRTDKILHKLKGHQKRVTGLAFSNVLKVLVSSGSDSQLWLWSMDGWEKLAGKSLQIPAGRVPSLLARTLVQFHQDQMHLLVVHETQIAIYEAPKLDCLKQWIPRETKGPITDATYSCDSQSIYASFEDGSVCILSASTLRLRCRINPAAYLPSNPSTRLYPVVVAAHPSEPNQFALGLTDGGVHVLEPPESEGKWGTLPVENGGVLGVSSAVVGVRTRSRAANIRFDEVMCRGLGLICENTWKMA